MEMIEIGALRPTAAIAVTETAIGDLESCVLTACLAEDSFFDVNLGAPMTLCGTFSQVYDPTSSVTTEVLTADSV